VSAVRPDGSYAGDVVRNAILAVLVGADIRADHAEISGGGKATDIRPQTLIVEAHAVDDGAIPREAEEARARIARLRPRRNRTAFDETKTEAQHGANHFGVLVKSGCQTGRVGQSQARMLQRHGKARVVDGKRRADEAGLERV